MTLRDRLVLFSSAQLVVFGLLFALTYVGVRTLVFPTLEEHLRSKADATARSLADRLDVALGADDAALVRAIVDQPFADDSTLAFVEVYDTRGTPVYHRGTAVDGVRQTIPIAFEGLSLGRVTAVFDTVDVDRIRAWAHAVLALVFVVWLSAALYSVRFARSFVAPIHAMKDFSHAVALGDFTRQLHLDADFELRELRDDLNAMARDLAHRETERLASHRRSQKLQRELVTASRKAGMAEVATGVLHNVGNVLNSLNVSVSLVHEQLRVSKVSALARSVRAFAEHPGGLAAFLATERGAQVPQYLAALVRQLEAENAGVRVELGAAARNVEHIKTIVATQQSHATKAHALEPVELAALVDDAVRIGAVSFAEHNIEIVRDYAEVPPVMTDRHRLLQSVINLVGNARHALYEVTAERRLTLGIAMRGHLVAITVADTGVGISTENLARVFEHGFTTKQSGHGFGLHASANALHEIGGTLAVTSAGPGKGATFTIELPLQDHERIYARAS